MEFVFFIRALEYVYSLLVNDITVTPSRLLERTEIWDTEVIDALQVEMMKNIKNRSHKKVLEALSIYTEPVSVDAIEYFFIDAPEEIPTRAMLSVLVKKCIMSSLIPIITPFFYTH